MKKATLFFILIISSRLYGAEPCDLDKVMDAISSSNVIDFAKEVSSIVKTTESKSKKFSQLSSSRILALSPDEICSTKEDSIERRGLIEERARNFCKESTKGKYPYSSSYRINSNRNDVTLPYKKFSSNKSQLVKLEIQTCRASKKYPHKFEEIICNDSLEVDLRSEDFIALTPKEVCVGTYKDEIAKYRNWILKKRADSICKIKTGGRAKNWTLNSGPNSTKKPTKS